MINKKYLPSENFIIRIIIIIVGVTLVLGIYELSTFLINKITKNEKTSVKSLLISDAIEKDSNNNGIPDWEEFLWGLDPKKNGKANKEFILSRKEELKQKQVNSSPNSTLSFENEALSQYFFASIVSLLESGNINEETLGQISTAFGKNISAIDIKDLYTRNSLNIIGDSMEEKKKYSEDVAKLVERYNDKNIGNELLFLAQGISSNDMGVMYATTKIGESYQLFASELIKIPVPESTSFIHLRVANSYAKNGACVKGMAQSFSDPILGMNSILGYKKYHEELSLDLENFSNFLF